MNEEEKNLWNGKPSQIQNWPIFLICGLTFWLVLPVFFAIWKYIELAAVSYQISTQRVFVQYGVFSRTTQEFELYRVKDYLIDEPFVFRFFSLGNLILKTSDRSNPMIILQAIQGADFVRNMIRVNVEELRETKNVREMDFIIQNK